jgi:hypothetical protein
MANVSLGLEPQVSVMNYDDTENVALAGSGYSQEAGTLEPICCRRFCVLIGHESGSLGL